MAIKNTYTYVNDGGGYNVSGNDKRPVPIVPSSQVAANEAMWDRGEQGSAVGGDNLRAPGLTVYPPNANTGTVYDQVATQPSQIVSNNTGMDYKEPVVNIPTNQTGNGTTNYPPVDNTVPPATPTVPTTPNADLVLPTAPVGDPVTVPETPALPSGVYETVYTDANGIPRTGYIINSTTYADPYGKTPVGIGSIVRDASGRQWIKTPEGSMLYEDYLASIGTGWEAPTLPTATDMSGYINDVYAAQREAQLAAIENAYMQNIAALDQQAATIPQYYYEAGRQTAGLNAREQQAMNERFNAAGLNTGAAGQAALAQNAVFQGNMAGIKQEEANALAEIEAERAALAIDYQNQIKEAILNNETEKAMALYAEAQRIDASIVDTAYQQALLDEKEYGYSVEAQNAMNKAMQDTNDKMYAYLSEKAASLAAVGDFSGFAALGYTEAEIAAMKAAYDKAIADEDFQAQLKLAEAKAELGDFSDLYELLGMEDPNATGGTNTGGGTYTGASNTPTMTLSTAKALASEGFIDADVAAVLMQNGYSANALEYLYGYKVNATANPGSAPALSMEAQNVVNAIKNGNDTVIANVLDYYRKSNRITDEELEYLLSLAGV